MNVMSGCPNCGAESQYLTVSQFAHELQMKEATIRAWILRRKIVYVTIGEKSVRIPRSEIDRLVVIVPAKIE